MNANFKKIFSIAVALAVGSVIIVFAWKGDLLTSTKVLKEEVTDNDDWKNSLLVVPQTNIVKTLVSQNTLGGEIKSENVEYNATTTTDTLARKLLVSYALTQKSMATTTWSEADADALAQDLIEDVKLPKAKQYTVKDLNITSDDNGASFALYGEKIVQLMELLSSKEVSNVATIFTNALSSNNQKKLDELTPIIAEYSKATKTLLTIETPSGLASIHLRLVQSHANTETAVILMQNMFNDPVQGLAGFIQYRKETESLIKIGNDYQNYKPASQ